MYEINTNIPLTAQLPPDSTEVGYTLYENGLIFQGKKTTGIFKIGTQTWQAYERFSVPFSGSIKWTTAQGYEASDDLYVGLTNGSGGSSVIVQFEQADEKIRTIETGTQIIGQTIEVG